MTAAFASGLTANRLQSLDFSRQRLQAPRPNPIDALSEKPEKQHFGLGELDVQSLSGLVVQLIIQPSSNKIGFGQSSSFGIKVPATRKKNLLNGLATKYTKNGILVHHTGKKISSEDVANALSEE